MGRVEFALVLCTFLLCALHLLRNLSPLFPLAYVGLVGVLLLHRLRALRVSIAQLTIIACYVLVAALTLINASTYGSPWTGLGRLFYLFPLVIYLFGVRFSDRQAVQLWMLLLGFTMASAGSLLFQIVFGPISWFAEASERAGATRFASLAGSLTIYGSIVGPACFLAWVGLRSGPIKVAAILLLLLGSALSLQKAAIAGLLIGMLMGVAAVRDRASLVSLAKALLVTGILLVLGVMLASYVLPPELTQSIRIFIVGALGAGGSDDYTFAESLHQRFVLNPLEAVHFFGWERLILGAGAYGAAGALGYAQFPMMHNLLGEVALMGGAALLVPFIVVSLLCGLRALRWVLGGTREARRIKLASGAFLLTFLVGLNTGSVHFHPVIGLFYWLSLRELTSDWGRWRQLAARRRYNPAPRVGGRV